MKETIKKIDGKNIEYKEEGVTEIQAAKLEDYVLDFVELGEAEMNVEDGKVTFCTMKSHKEEKSDGKKSEGKKKFEDDIVKFETLLTEAHKKAKADGFDLNILTNVVRDKEGKPMINLENNFAMFKARVSLTKDSKEIFRYEGHGDATEENVKGEFIKPHFIRMAETRAIVRALRWYTNNGCAEEEK